MTPKDNTGVAEQTMPSPRKMEMEITTDSNPGETTVDIRKGYLKGIPLAVVTISLCLGTFLVALDVNIIGVAVPRIATAFRSLDDVAWYGSGYLLTVTAFQPTMGVIYKYFDVRLTYISVIFIFEGEGPTHSNCQGAIRIISFLIAEQRQWDPSSVLRHLTPKPSLSDEQSLVSVQLVSSRELLPSSGTL